MDSTEQSAPYYGSRAASAVLAIVAIASIFIVAEVIKQWLAPGLPKWQCQLLSVAFVASISTPAVIFFFRMLRARERDNARVLQENAARQEAERELAENLRFERLVAKLSATLIDLPSDKLDATLHDAIRRIGEFMQVDRCGMAEISQDGERVRITHLWTVASSQRSEPRTPIAQEPAPDLAWFARRMARGEALVFASPDQVPEEAKGEAEYLRRFGVRSGVVVPLSAGDGIIRAFSVQMVRAERSWSREELRRLRFVGEILTNALVRQRSEDALRDLGGRLIEVQEDERRRIALELHDDVSQKLALLSIDLESLGLRPHSEGDELRERATALAARVKELVSDVQRVSHGLHDSRLEQLSLADAVEGLCRDLAGRHGLRIEFDHSDVPDKLPRDMALCLYRIAQEGLQNVAKHSGADLARVELAGTEGEICLRISDFGTGFDVRAQRPGRGIGLLSMEERIRLVGGTLSIESAPSRGTRIEACVPLAASVSASLGQTGGTRGSVAGAV